MATKDKHNPRTCEEHAACIKARVDEAMAKINDRSKAVPESADQTVAVRAHWRRHPGHLRKMPKTKMVLRAAILQLIKGDK